MLRCVPRQNNLQGECLSWLTALEEWAPSWWGGLGGKGRKLLITSYRNSGSRERTAGGGYVDFLLPSLRLHLLKAPHSFQIAPRMFQDLVTGGPHSLTLKMERPQLNVPLLPCVLKSHIPYPEFLALPCCPGIRDSLAASKLMPCNLPPPLSAIQ